MDGTHHRRPDRAAAPHDAGALRLATGSDGRALVAWSEGDDASPPEVYGDAGRGTVFVADTAADGTFGPAGIASPRGVDLADAALGPGGAAALAWVTATTRTTPLGPPDATPGRVQAAVRPAGRASFAAAEDVSPAEARAEDDAASLAWDPLTGRPVVAWVGTLDGQPFGRLAVRIGT